MPTKDQLRLSPPVQRHLARHGFEYAALAIIGAGVLLGYLQTADDPYHAYHVGVVEGLWMTVFHPLTLLAVLLLVWASRRKNRDTARAVGILACVIIASTAYEMIISKPDE